MTNSKDLSSLMDRNFVMPDLSGLTRISESLVALQTSELQRAIQTITDSQRRIFENASFISSLNDFVDAIHKAMMPTQDLMDSLLKATSNFRINITSFQNINDSLSITLKAINSIVDIHTSIEKDVSEVESLANGSSCLVSMSAEVKERYDTKSIVYENSANVQIVAEITEIKEGQKQILEELASFKKTTANHFIPAKLTDIGFINGSRSMISINGKAIQFNGGIASVILHIIFGRKNFSKTRSYEPIDFYDKCENNDWFCVGEEEHKKFQKKVYQSIRNINNRFMEATNFDKKLIIQDGNNSYILNPDLFK